MTVDFTEAYHAHVWLVYGFFAYRVRERTEAEDLTQLTFERALRAWPRFDPARASVGRWMMAIARNLLIDHYRADRSARHDAIDDGGVAEHELGSTAGPEEDLGLDPALAAALERLGEREREVLALRFGADLTGPQIAEVCDLSLANVQQILSRTLRWLRDELGRERPEAGATEHRR
jgi:RNA polymerase sigma-70 factor (ECF subfamily)